MSVPSVAELNRLVTGFDRLYGLRLIALDDREVRAEVTVTDDLKQPLGLLHGGVMAAVAESVASIGTAMAVMADGRRAVGQSNATSFLRPITGGTLHATARRIHRGSSSWVWDVEMADDEGRPCAITRMTIAVRPGPGGKN